MSDANKQVLQQANEAIAQGDYEGFLRFCTDDTVWTFEGEQTLQGKAAVRQWMATAYALPPVFELHRMIAEGDFVAALGEITLTDGQGRAVRHAYCDVWRFRGGLMSALQAFVVKKL